MTKNEFLVLLESHLSVLPPEERNELMEDYEAHFAFALQNGKSEEEVVRELGDPLELAKTALEERQPPLSSNPVYWYYSDKNDVPPSPAPGPAQGFEPVKHRERGTGAKIGMISALFIPDVVVFSLLFSFWLTAICLMISGGLLLLSPLFYVANGMIYGSYHLAKLYASISFVGIGILLLIGSKPFYQSMVSLLKQYWQWNLRLVKGNVNHD